MNYFAGNPSNTSKFMHASFDPTTHTNLNQGLEALEEAAGINRDYKLASTALGAFGRGQEALAEYETQKQLAKINQASQSRSNFMSGLGSVISAGAGLASGFGGVDRAFNADLSAGLTGNEFANAPSQFGGGVNFFGT